MAQKPLSQEEVKEKFMEFKIVQQHIEHISEQAEVMAQQHTELELSKHAVEEVEKAPLHQEMLAPLANGIFVQGELKNTKKLIVNVGSNVTVERTSAEVIGLLEQQERKLLLKMAEVQEVMQQLQAHAQALFEQIKDHVDDDG